MCVWGGEGEGERARERERERGRTSGLSQSVSFSPTYFISCNGPCAPKEKWHRKEHIIIIIYYFSPTVPSHVGPDPTSGKESDKNGPILQALHQKVKVSGTG